MASQRCFSSILLLLLASISLNAQSLNLAYQTDTTLIWTEKVICGGLVKDGFRIGCWTCINMEGQKIEEGSYIRSFRVGKWVTYYPGGQIRTETDYPIDTAYLKDQWPSLWHNTSNARNEVYQKMLEMARESRIKQDSISHNDSSIVESSINTFEGDDFGNDGETIEYGPAIWGLDDDHRSPHGKSIHYREDGTIKEINYYEHGHIIKTESFD